ncbi:farnesol dehydrogenase-like [Belonocnema kinseyi]|uniref:farnesol dehydrogenase-like n=1 Tax=Belonocnema kinseyi TaxID=2817044 RepID=UPI00143D838C|nr:farnesol dehydrogenase-like [Belonocnema kinseyi]
MERWFNKVAVVTGASTGIGAIISEGLVKAGVNVVGLARKVDKLEEIKTRLKNEKGKFYSIQTDVTKEDEILRAFRWIEKELGGVDILVNNAGVILNEPIIDGGTEGFKTILDVNVLAVAICTREATKSMRNRKVPGHVVIINSFAGHYAESIKVPVSLYCASKYAITGMTESLRNELAAAKANIKVTSISPAAVRTGMLLNAGIPEAVINQISILETKDVLDAVIYVLGTPPNVQVNELTLTSLGLPHS